MVLDHDGLPRYPGGLLKQLIRMEGMVENIHEEHRIHFTVSDGESVTVEGANRDRGVGADQDVKPDRVRSGRTSRMARAMAPSPQPTSSTEAPCGSCLAIRLESNRTRRGDTRRPWTEPQAIGA